MKGDKDNLKFGTKLYQTLGVPITVWYRVFCLYFLSRNTQKLNYADM